MFKSMKSFLAKEIDQIKQDGLYKEERIITTPQRAAIKVKPGKEVINFCAKKRDIAKYLFYLRKAAQSYYRLGDYGRALDSAQEGLEREPEDEQLIKLRDMAQDELNIRLRK